MNNISVPGIYQVSAADYHADCVSEPSLSASIANVLLNQSPAHAWQQSRRLNPNFVPDEDSRFDLGTLAHAMLLEQDDSKLVVVDAADWRSKAAKDSRDAARANGKVPVLAKYEPALRAMGKVARETIERTELAGIFNRGKPERSLIWQDEGIWCRARPDWLTDDYGTILEFKTTTSASPSFFTRQIGNMSYDLQAEFYRRGIAALNLHDNPIQVILAQELDEPYACALYTLSNDYIEIAQHKCERAIATWRMCMQSGLWPAYGDDITVIYPPAWESHAYAQRLALEDQA